ncbi:MAG: WXG100 family type VII secretion target [Clostridia bacterium]|nr:WXG100 family type VII secretion target [Clostridia bacterium]
MADIVFRYEEMESAANALEGLAEQYKSAANKLNDDYMTSTSSWEGDSKTRMDNFMTGAVLDYTGTTVPGLIDALAQILRANAQQMQNADQQIADSIPTSL